MPSRSNAVHPKTLTEASFPEPQRVNVTLVHSPSYKTNWTANAQVFPSSVSIGGGFRLHDKANTGSEPS